MADVEEGLDTLEAAALLIASGTSQPVWTPLVVADRVAAPSDMLAAAGLDLQTISQ